MLWTYLLLLIGWFATTHGLLYPAESETRQIRSLDGVWQFRLDDAGVGETERWFAMPHLPQPTILMPVPASYNDITQNISIYRYVGVVWYEKDFYIHNTASRWVLRFQAARYETHVWVNGQSAVNHTGGHLPFEVDITPFIRTNDNYSKMQIVVAVNNTLTYSTLPPASANLFYNYGGIDRSVILYSTSSAYIEDITIDTESIDYDAQHLPTSAVLNYSVTIAGNNQPMNALQVLIQLLDANGVVVADSTDFQSRLIVNKPNLWEPCGMNHTHSCTEESYLYTLQVTLYNGTSQTDVVDIYRIPHVGIRTIRLTDSKFLVNERPFYFHGVNAHEDSDIRGKGFDHVLLSKHFNLYGWLHGNSFRTSHYPYADEFYYMADRYGLAIIDESPAAGLNNVLCFSEVTLEHHKQVITEMINRDKNHPSVLMWSLANEPLSSTKEASVYFSTLFNFTRPIAVNRPITFVTYGAAETDQCVQFADVICINRYFGWYVNPGRLDQIPEALTQDITSYRTTYPTKPIIVSEYGTETLPGLHNDPPLMFTEEYQKDFYTTYHNVFDNYSSLLHPDTGYLIGELPWNMYEFAQVQSINSMAECNWKGLFTRQRQPKAAAFVIKNRYEQLELIPTLFDNYF
jgi:beta-glucuronidase